MTPIRPDKFPAILAHELDGLQKITAQNVRLRVEPKLFCHSWAQYGDYPTITLPDGRVEIALGDLVSEESREFVLLTEVLPLPLLPGGELPASLEGEELLGLEFFGRRSAILRSKVARVRTWCGSKAPKTRRK